MSVFEDYAYYYDLLYRDKDYSGESNFICKLMAQYTPDSGTILELGCGTCGHAEHLAKAGHLIHGVDFSTNMLKIAEARRAILAPELRQKICLTKGDVRSVELGQKFDVVLSLFHVMSYQITNDDLLAAFATAQKHLNKGGIFIFDCWYGPAVLVDPPVVRIKRIEADDIQIIRLAEPVLDINNNLVTVKYQMLMIDKKTHKVKSFFEDHVMRYLFEPEISEYLKSVGIELIHTEEWLTGKTPGSGSWNISVVGKKVRDEN